MAIFVNNLSKNKGKKQKNFTKINKVLLTGQMAFLNVVYSKLAQISHGQGHVSCGGRHLRCTIWVIILEWRQHSGTCTHAFFL